LPDKFDFINCVSGLRFAGQPKGWTPNVDALLR
jgi:hypothetical protein